MNLTFVNSLKKSRWFILVILTIALFALLLSPPPFSTLLLLTWGGIGAGLAFQRTFQLKLDTQTWDRVTSIRIRPQILATVLAVLGTGLLIRSAWQFRAGSLPEAVGEAAWLMLVGGFVLGGALWVGRRSSDSVLPLPEPSRETVQPVLLNRRFLTLGLGALAVLVAINIAPDTLPVLLHTSPHIQIVLFIVGISLLGAGLSGVRLKRSAARFEVDETLRQGVVNWRYETAILLAILLLAALPRLYMLGQTTRFEVDELQAIVGINTLESTQVVHVLGTVKPLHWDWSWMFPYIQTWLVGLGGHNWFGLRLIGVVFGLASIAALYALARAWFDRWTAIMAALLLAALPAHIHFSRISIINIADPVWGVFALAALSWGMRTGRRGYFVAGGVLLGLTQYFYEGGRLLFPPLIVAWLVGVAILWPGRVTWRQFRLVLLAAGLVALPFYVVMLVTGRPFAERMGDNFAGWDYLFSSTRILLPRLAQPLLTFIHDPDWKFAYVYYGGYQPVLQSYVVPFFLLGLSYMLWRIRQPGMLMLALWLLLITLGNVVIRDNGMVARYVAVFPGLALLAAVGIRHTLALILPGRIRWSMIVSAVLVAVLCFSQVYYYFAVHLPQYEIDFRERRPGRDLDDAIQRMTDIPADTDIYIITDLLTDVNTVDLYYENQVRWMSDFLLDRNDIHIFTTTEVQGGFIAALPRSSDKAFFLVPDDIDTLRLIRSVYPDVSAGIPSPNPDIPHDEEFILYRVAGIRDS